MWRNFQKCSTLYFQMKVVCFAKQKEKDSKNFLLSFYSSSKIPTGRAHFRSLFFVSFFLFLRSTLLYLPRTAIFPPHVCFRSMPALLVAERRSLHMQLVPALLHLPRTLYSRRMSAPEVCPLFSSQRDVRLCSRHVFNKCV